MKLSEQYQVCEMAGEHIIVMPGRYGESKTRILALNASSLVLWEQLQGREFDLDVAAQVLVDEYGIELDVARQDAQRWIDKLVECEIIV